MLINERWLADQNSRKISIYRRFSVCFDSSEGMHGFSSSWERERSSSNRTCGLRVRWKRNPRRSGARATAVPVRQSLRCHADERRRACHRCGWLRRRLGTNVNVWACRSVSGGFPSWQKMVWAGLEVPVWACRSESAARLEKTGHSRRVWFLALCLLTEREQASRADVCLPYLDTLGACLLSHIGSSARANSYMRALVRQGQERRAGGKTLPCPHSGRSSTLEFRVFLSHSLYSIRISVFSNGSLSLLSKNIPMSGTPCCHQHFCQKYVPQPSCQVWMLSISHWSLPICLIVSSRKDIRPRTTTFSLSNAHCLSTNIFMSDSFSTIIF